MTPRRLTLEETPAYAAKLFLHLWGSDATPEQLSKLHLDNPPYRECDLLCNVQSWLRHIQDIDGVDWIQTSHRSEILLDLERDPI